MTDLGKDVVHRLEPLQRFNVAGLAAGWSQLREDAQGQIHAFRYIATPVFVPVVLSAFAQTGGALFNSEMILANRGNRPAAIRFNYTSASGAGTGSTNIATFWVAGQQRVISNTINYLRGQGLPIPRARETKWVRFRLAFYGLSSPLMLSR